MRIRPQEESEGELINMSSLLDVVFILLIFFIATTTFQQEEKDMQVNLPQASDGKALSSAPSVLVINVRDTGEYLLGSQMVTLEQLAQQMKAAAENQPDQKVLVRGDENARHGDVSRAMLTCRQAGIHKANIAYELPQ